MRSVGWNLDVQTLPRAFLEILKPNWMWYKSVVGVFQKGDQMNLGQFSMSLTVKNLSVSKDFYETLRFIVFGGAIERNYLIMKQADTLIGFFRGMFEYNILTFNPGWNSSAENVDPFEDIRELQAQPKHKGIDIDVQEVAPDSSGRGHFIFNDPDGNLIMVDQHR